MTASPGTAKHRFANRRHRRLAVVTLLLSPLAFSLSVAPLANADPVNDQAGDVAATETLTPPPALNDDAAAEVETETEATTIGGEEAAGADAAALDGDDALIPSTSASASPNSTIEGDLDPTDTTGDEDRATGDTEVVVPGDTEEADVLSASITPLGASPVGATRAANSLYSSLGKPRAVGGGAGLPSCEAGDAYAMGEDGKMYRLAPNGTQWQRLPGGDISVEFPDNDNTKVSLNGLGVYNDSNGVSTWYTYQRSLEHKVVPGSPYPWVRPYVNVFRNVDGRGWEEVASYKLGNFNNGETIKTNTYVGIEPITAPVIETVIGGAVNPVDGSYWILQFYPHNGTQDVSSDGKTEVRLYRVSPDGVPEGKGQFVVDEFGPPGANGDLAFDSMGNAYIVQTMSSRGYFPDDDGNTRIHTVKADVLKAATTNSDLEFQSSTTRQLKGLERNTGIAFDFPNGHLIVSDLNQSASFDINDLSRPISTAGGLSRSYDLTSCSFPHTIELWKNVSKRIDASDQFTLDIARVQDDGSADSITDPVTTTGSATGPQSKMSGPHIGAENAKYRLSEALASGSVTTDLSEYHPEITCTEIEYAQTATPLEVNVVPAGTPGAWDVTIPRVPAGGSESMRIKCEITNNPAQDPVLRVVKEIQSPDGATSTPAPSWPFTLGGSDLPATETTKTTDQSGNASWTLTPGTVSLSENLVVDDTSYEFVSGSCEPTPVTDGADANTGAGATKTNTDFTTSADGNSVTVSDLVLAAGDDVTCRFVNRVKLYELSIKKTDASNGRSVSGAQFELWKDDNGNGTVDADDTKVGEQTTDTKGTATFTNLVAGSYLAKETTAPTGYKLLAEPVAVTVPATDGTNVTVNVENERLPGTVTWNKVDGNGQPLSGSIWKLTPPPPKTDADAITVEDCVADSADACSGPDRDPAAGAFSVTDLQWGQWQLEETAAPAGYQRVGGTSSFTISRDQLNYSFTEPFVNPHQAVPGLPLTGGLGSDMFLYAGGPLLAVGLLLSAVMGGRRLANRHAH